MSSSPSEERNRSPSLPNRDSKDGATAAPAAQQSADAASPLAPFAGGKLISEQHAQREEEDGKCDGAVGVLGMEDERVRFNIPEHTWTRRFDAEDPAEEVHKPSMPDFLEALSLLPLAYRLGRYIHNQRLEGRLPILDLQIPSLQPVRPGPHAGVPLGGIGGGCIGRGWRGGFRRWSLAPGSYHHKEVIADQFSVFIQRGHRTFSQVLSTRKTGDPTGSLSSWSWGLDPSKAVYYALYPRAWTVYDLSEAKVRLVCKQISPVIPHNYTESSLPMGVFEWTVENYGDDEVLVGLLFSFQNGDGGVADQQGGHYNAPFGFKDASRKCYGIRLHHRRKVRTVKVKHPTEHSPTPASLLQKLPSRFVSNPTTYEFKEDDEAEAKRRREEEVISAESQLDPWTFCIACPRREDVLVTYNSCFPTNQKGGGESLWRHFSSTGTIGAERIPATPRRSASGETIGAALCQTAVFPPRKARGVDSDAPDETKFVFSLSWDIPLVRFGEGKAYPRMYTHFFGEEGTASEQMAEHALYSYTTWDRAISAWQSPTLSSSDLPSWFKSALFNELYYITDGGTVWVTKGGRDGEYIGPLASYRPKGPARVLSHPSFRCCQMNEPQKRNEAGAEGQGWCMKPDPITYSGENKTDETTGQDHSRKTEEDGVGHFLYLEGHEYLMYNTYDVHFYASFALVMNWPLLELSLQRDFAQAVMQSDPEVRPLLSDGQERERKIEGQVPHDVGSPGEDPWNKVNAYNFQDVGLWKDLGPKFVLQVYRDYVATGDRSFLIEMYPVIKQVIAHCAQFDKDGDGLVENEGFPDQTYDIWTVQGPSAYTGGLWLASLAAALGAASQLDDKNGMRTFGKMLRYGRHAYEALLWNGSYFNYDNGSSITSKSIMADQMAGLWYTRACGLYPIVEEDKAESVLSVIYSKNVLSFKGGRMGAVNGMTLGGEVDQSCLQSREVWTGTTYALAATMLQEAHLRKIKSVERDSETASKRPSSVRPTRETFEMRTAAYKTAEGIYRFGWQQGGYWFATPESWDKDGNYRSMGYMRPLAIWALHWAEEIVPFLPMAAELHSEAASEGVRLSTEPPACQL